MISDRGKLLILHFWGGSRGLRVLNQGCRPRSTPKRMVPANVRTRRSIGVSGIMSLGTRGPGSCTSAGLLCDHGTALTSPPVSYPSSSAPVSLCHLIQFSNYVTESPSDVWIPSLRCLQMATAIPLIYPEGVPDLVATRVHYVSQPRNECRNPPAHFTFPLRLTSLRSLTSASEAPGVEIPTTVCDSAFARFTSPVIQIVRTPSGMMNAGSQDRRYEGTWCFEARN